MNGRIQTNVICCFLFGAGAWYPWSLIGAASDVPMLLRLGGPIVTCFVALVLQYLVLVLPSCIQAKLKQEVTAVEPPEKTQKKRMATAVSVGGSVCAYLVYISRIVAFANQDRGERNGELDSSVVVVVGKAIAVQLVCFNRVVYSALVSDILRTNEARRRNAAGSKTE
mmetsp:Transcript_2079/g.3497  ORF Transcript_2079/g.3497 Transcript_2079/m.3497 type:complete len:168 (-) Transcript_2079:195-698(-)